MSKKYDVIVIGSGPAGSHVATACAKKGLKVAVADYLFGGTCALRGCTPKKAMESVTSAWWTAHHLQEHGFPKLAKPVDWQKLLVHCQEFTALVPSGTKRKFQKAGIELIEKKVAFAGKTTLTDGKNKWAGKNIVIATGAIPRPFKIKGSEYLWNSADFFELPQLPKRIVFIGGGYVGFELSHIAAACGSQVTIISDEQKPLGAFDSNLVSEFIRATLEKGIDVRLGYEAEHILQNEEESFQVKVKRKGYNKTYQITADAIFNTTGRVPAIESLNLAKAKIKAVEKEGIQYNDYLQCEGNEQVYVVGDVNGQFPFTPVGHIEADRVVYNLLNKKPKKIIYPTVPSVLYGFPKLAGIGKTQAQLEEEGIDFEIISDSLEDDLVEKGKHNPFAGYRIFIDKKTDKILGAFVLSVKADDTINLLTMAIQTEMKAHAVQQLLLAYPTATHAVKFMVES